MAVSNETIIRKMMQELTAAQAVQHNGDKMKQHIANVRILCELLLEEQHTEETKTQAVDPNEISEAEWKAMLGSSSKPPQLHRRSESLDHDDANGDSIFDF